MSDFFNQPVALIANGEISSDQVIAQKLKGYDCLIAVDGGLNHCQRLKIAPTLLIGDLDSASSKARAAFPDLPMIVLNREKDWSDLDFAIQWVSKKKPSSMTLFGSFGLRIDHSLSNLIALTRYPGKLFIETESERIGAINKSIQLVTYSGQTVSLIPINGPAKGIKTRGLKWELQNRTLDKTFIGISNIATQKEVHISLTSGDLLFSLHD